MNRTAQELRNRIINVEAQRDAVVSVLCEQKQEIDGLKRRIKELGGIARMLERERDQAVRRAEIAEQDIEDELNDEILDEMDEEDDEIDDACWTPMCPVCKAKLHGRTPCRHYRDGSFDTMI